MPLELGRPQNLAQRGSKCVGIARGHPAAAFVVHQVTQATGVSDDQRHSARHRLQCGHPEWLAE
jgi:hypothetical protein